LRAGRRTEVNNSVNWILIIVGALAVVAEVILGAVTGFDLALIGCALAAGGAVGLLFGSPELGLLSAGVFSFLYLAFLRRNIRSKLTGPNRATNIDAVIGRTAVVVEPIAPHGAGMVRLGDELWRAALKDEGEGAAAIATGATVVVDSVEGVTLKVR
jgi:membrane protein implicated in regulation of membrane protease activity